MNDEHSKPAIAVIPWGDVIEDWLETIGLTADDFVERMTGGWLLGYVAALQHVGWRPIIVFPSIRASKPTRLIHAGTGAPVWIVPGQSVYRGRFASVYSVRRWLATPLSAFREVFKREDCRVLMIQEYEDTRLDVLVRLAVWLGIRAYASFQGGDRTLSRIERLVRTRSLEMCSGLVIASSEERQRVKKQYAGRHPPIANIPNPLDANEWRGIDRREARSLLGIPQEGFVAINHGRIQIYRKGLDVLLDAWAASGGDELVVIGSGTDREAFAALIARHGSSRVRWLANFTNDRPLIRRWLSAADVYITASRIEGMPVAALEAMACGLPIIASDAQGLPDILEGGETSGGLIVPRDDAPALTAAIERLRADPDLRGRLGRAARQRIERAFSIPVVGAALGQFLDQTGAEMP